MQFCDRSLNFDLVGNAEVLKLPGADEVVMQFEGLFAIVRLLGGNFDGGVFVGNVDDPDGGGIGNMFEILKHDRSGGLRWRQASNQ